MAGESSKELTWSRVSTSSRMTTEAQASRSERVRGSWTRSEAQGGVRQDSPRNFQNMPFGEVPPPVLGEDLKAHIGGFHPFTPEWYYSLPANSVDSFEMLCAWFMARFADNKPTTASSASLQHVTQGDFESLRQYMTRFTKATLAIHDLHPAMAMHALLVGLKPSPFLDMFYVDPPSNMDNLRDKATRYISIEENVEARKRKFQPHVAGGGFRFPKRIRLGRYDHYTPLNVTREVVLQKACNSELVQLSHPGRHILMRTRHLVAAITRILGTRPKGVPRSGTSLRSTFSRGL